jgi:hypothetical protein
VASPSRRKTARGEAESAQPDQTRLNGFCEEFVCSLAPPERLGYCRIRDFVQKRFEWRSVIATKLDIESFRKKVRVRYARAKARKNFMILWGAQKIFN